MTLRSARPPASQPDAPDAATIHRVFFALIAGAAFGLYWLSSFVLEARNATKHFGADTWFYAEIARGDVVGRIPYSYHLDRIVRFHPTTVAMAVGWMEALGPVTHRMSPHHLLRAMFAAVGAIGVWAAMSAFAAIIPRGCVLLFGIIYAVSLDVWYFSSIEESKIVTASLSAIYIAVYLRLRANWTMRGAVCLTGVLLLACLNEIASGALILIPVVDTLVRQGWAWRTGRWIAVHGLAGPLALIILEGIINGRLSAAGRHPEGASHFSMFLHYISNNDFSAASFYSFVLNWLFFNIAAPTAHATHAVAAWPDYKGFFEPALANYLSTPVSVGLVALFGLMIIAGVLCRGHGKGATTGIIVALMTYALVRGLFFFIFNPAEPLLFSPAVTLAHLLVIGIPFAASTFPAKRTLLAMFATLLFVCNSVFIFG